MNPEVKKKWLEALRGGEYLQGNGALHPTEDTFCCLGVLCDLYLREKGGEWVKSYHPTVPFYLRDADGVKEKLTLPLIVADWAEISSSPLTKETTTPGDRKRLSLVNLNDSGWNFNKIADVIERDL